MGRLVSFLLHKYAATLLQSSKVYAHDFQMYSP